MNHKVYFYFLGIFVGLLLLAGTFSGGLLIGVAIPRNSAVPFFGGKSPSMPALPGSSSTATVAVDREQLFKPFWQTWDLVHTQYVEQPVDDQKLMQGAIRGMLASLGDQHTSYMDPDQYRQNNTPLVGSYEGIGAWVDVTGEYLTITAPMPKSPAEAAGLKTGDKIIAVDGEDMTGIDGNLVLRRVLGPAASKVKLTILRKGETKPFDVEITRQKIVVPSVEAKMLPDNIAYVRLFTYGDTTTADMRKEMKLLLDQKPTGMILDLRNNGGGYLKTAIEVVSEFIPSGTVMYEVYGDGRKETFKAQRGGLATNIPLVVLVNEGTASASEITAGAIQDLQRGKLVGVKTYGKGSVQTWTPLVNNEGAARITIARWLTPNERQINKIGLLPDVEVKLTEDDITAGRDPQLDKAVEVLKLGK